MKAILRATAILGSASLATVLIGLVSSKVTAVLLGPSGFGLMALFQAIVTLAVMVAGLGLPTAFVRAGARAIGQDDLRQEANLRHAAWLISAAAALAAFLLMLAGRNWINAIAFESRAEATWVLFIAPAIVLSVFAGLQTAVVNARRRVGDLARINVLSALLTLPPTIILIWLLREKGVAAVVAGNILITFLVSRFYYRRSAPSADDAPSPSSAPALRAAGKGLLGFGIPFMGSVAAGAGVQSLLPILVLHALGPAEVGLFRAASAIAVNYLGVILAAMAQDYFPRVAATSDDATVLNRIVNEQLRLVLLLSGPIIIAMTGAVPFLVPLLYSSKFAGAASLLQWQLMGDLFKFSTWTMSFVIMVKLGGRTFFLTELAGGAMLLASSWFGMRLWGLSGLGIAFLATGAFVCLVNWAVLRGRIRLRWSRANIGLFVMLASALAAIRALASYASPWSGVAASFALAAIFGGYSVRALWRELGGRDALRARFRTG